MSDPETRLLNGGHGDPARWLGIGEVVRLAIPTVLNMTGYTIMQFADGLMVSWVGPEALSAQLGGGISAFTCMCFFLGTLSVVSTFASQNLGAGRPERGARYGWQGLWLAWTAAACLVPLFLLAPYFFNRLGHTPEVTRLETLYFRIMLGGAVFMMSSRALGSWFVGMHRPAVVLVAGVVANSVNVAANWVLIFGHLGFPRLGLAGAGLGTVIGFVVELSILGGVFLFSPLASEFHTRRAWRLDRRAMRDLLRVGTPAGAMFLGELVMWTTFMIVIIGRLGTDAMTASAILNRYFHLCFMPALGVAAAVTAIVGRHCGAGRPELAMRRAHAGFLLIESYMLGMGTVLWLGRTAFVGIFNGLELEWGGSLGVTLGGTINNPDIQAMATSVFIFLLLSQAFDAMNVTFIGALRGAGDTFWPGVIQLVLAYGLGLGGAAFVAWARPEWGIAGPWAAVTCYITVLGCVMWGRFLRGRWRTLRLVEPKVAPLVDDAAGLPPP